MGGNWEDQIKVKIVEIVGGPSQYNATNTMLHYDCNTPFLKGLRGQILRQIVVYSVLLPTFTIFFCLIR